MASRFSHFKQLVFEALSEWLYLIFKIVLFSPSYTENKSVENIIAFFVFLQSKEHMCRISDLQEELRHREHHISDLDKEVQHLHENISTLTKELEHKGKEILRIRSESNQQMRYVSNYSGR